MSLALHPVGCVDFELEVSVLLSFRPLRAALPAAVAGLTVLLPGALVAQESDPDFLFRRPLVSVALKGGWTVPGEGGEIFDFTRDQLTVAEGDFATLSVAGEVAARVSERIDLALELGWARSEQPSELRDFVELDDQPITQVTRFERRPITLSVRGYLFERGRTVGSYAWIPATWSPYLGVGAGWMTYAFEQEGDFVDFQSYDPTDGTYEIFTAQLRSEGTGGLAHVLGGVEWAVLPRLFLTAEGRYQWAEAEMDGGFAEFGEIDLTGAQFTVGLGYRF